MQYSLTQLDKLDIIRTDFPDCKVSLQGNWIWFSGSGCFRVKSYLKVHGCIFSNRRSAWFHTSIDEFFDGHLTRSKGYHTFMADIYDDNDDMTTVNTRKFSLCHIKSLVPDVVELCEYQCECFSELVDDAAFSEAYGKLTSGTISTRNRAIVTQIALGLIRRKDNTIEALVNEIRAYTGIGITSYDIQLSVQRQARRVKKLA